MFPDCPCKDAAIAAAKKAVKAVPGVKLVLRSEAADQARANALGIIISPAFVLDGKICAIGKPGLEQLIRKLRDRTQGGK